jgi:hypothetical protein
MYDVAEGIDRLPQGPRQNPSVCTSLIAHFLHMNSKGHAMKQHIKLVFHHLRLSDQLKPRRRAKIGAQAMRGTL